MPYVSALVDHVYFVQWTSAPTSGEVVAVLRELSQAHATLGRPPVLCTIVPDGSSPPDATVRSAMVRLAPLLFAHCTSGELVFEGTSLHAALMRTVMRALVALIGSYRSRLFFHATVDAAVARVASELGAPAEAVVRDARQRGLGAARPGDVAASDVGA